MPIFSIIYDVEYYVADMYSFDMRVGPLHVDLDAVGGAVVPLACGAGRRKRGDSWGGRVVDAAERRVVASYETHAAVWVVGVVGRGSVCLISMSP